MMLLFNVRQLLVIVPLFAVKSEGKGIMDSSYPEKHVDR